MKLPSEEQVARKLQKADMKLEEMAVEFDVQITRMWRIMHGSPMKASEYIKFVKYFWI